VRSLKLHVPVIAILVVASNANAQSSVTLYGSLDVALAYFNNTGHASVFQMQSGDLQSTFWGLRGTEDLGGGLKALFDLESGVDITSGRSQNGGRLFGRQSYVGLQSDKLGTVTLGRQYDPTIDLVQPITGDVYGPAFATPGDADNNDGTVWVNNAIKYASPTYAGFQYALMYALGGVPGSASSGHTYAAAALYTNGGLSLATGYFFAKNDGPAGAGTADLTQNNSVTPLFDSVAMVGSRQIVQVAAQYVVGNLTGNVRYSNAQYKPYMNFGAFNRTQTFNIAGASLGYQLTPAELLSLGYVYARTTGGSSATYNNVAASSAYSLSKTTILYATAAYSHASGTTFSADGTTLVSAGGSIGDVTSSSGTPNQVGVMLGMVHKF
jgi:predicted porin